MRFRKLMIVFRKSHRFSSHHECYKQLKRNYDYCNKRNLHRNCICLGLVLGTISRPCFVHSQLVCFLTSWDSYVWLILNEGRKGEYRLTCNLNNNFILVPFPNYTYTYTYISLNNRFFLNNVV